MNTFSLSTLRATGVRVDIAEIAFISIHNRQTFRHVLTADSAPLVDVDSIKNLPCSIGDLLTDIRMF